MELGEALMQLHAIRSQVARTETFRGYRAATVGCTGCLAFIFAGWQAIYLAEPAQNPMAFIQLWVIAAAFNAGLVASELAWQYFRTDSLISRPQTLRAAEQFVPCIVAGAVLTFVMQRYAGDSLHLLPGLWSILFGLGIFSSLPQMPKPIVFVGLHYLLAGAGCIAFARDGFAFSPWAMAISFGGGQLLTSAILYFTTERSHGA